MHIPTKTKLRDKPQKHALVLRVLRVNAKRPGAGIVSKADDERWLNKELFGVILYPTYGDRLVFKTGCTKSSAPFFMCDVPKPNKAGKYKLALRSNSYDITHACKQRLITIPR